MLLADETQGRTYSKGQLNKMIDSVMHPLFKKDAKFIIVDSALHALVEQNPTLSISKFLKYNLQEIVQQTVGKDKLRKKKVGSLIRQLRKLSREYQSIPRRRVRSSAR